jgi:hypothetical protein
VLKHKGFKGWGEISGTKKAFVKRPVKGILAERVGFEPTKGY